MNHNYEFIHYEFGLPVKIFINSDDNYKPHFHKGLELIWVLDGRATLLVEREEYILQENDLLLINSFKSHTIVESTERTTYLVMHVDDNFCSKCIPDFYNQYFELRSTKSDSAEQGKYESIRYWFSRIVWAYNKKVKNFRDVIHDDLTKLFEYIAANFTKADPVSRDFEADRRDWNKIKNIISFIEKHYQEKLTLQGIADQEHYNLSYLSESFKRNVGITFRDYLDKVRLQKAMPEILYGKKSITEIAYDNGFNNLKSFYRAFKQNYACTPLEYKELFNSVVGNYVDRQQEPESFNIHEKLSAYLKMKERESSPELSVNEKKISVDLSREKGRLNKAWQKLINIGSAFTVLDNKVQDQIKEMQGEIGFEYLRFEGIFNDELEVCKEAPSSGIYYNWKMVDKVLDFVLSVKLKPFICLSFMPRALARTQKKVFYYKAYASPPKQMEKWLHLVHEFIVHCINRYGFEQVSSWYFQIWHEFSFNNVHWDGADEEYWEFYRLTAEEIKAVSPVLKVGPAAENYYYGIYKTEEFLRYCWEQKAPIDFYCADIYHNQIANTHALNFNKNEFFDDKLIFNIRFSLFDKMHTINTIRRTQQLISVYFLDKLDFFVVRWNISWDVKELIHDTAFMAPNIIDNVLKTHEYVAGMGFLSLSDILSEWPIDYGPFYGGSGLFNTEGIKKSSYYAFLLLSKLGGKLVDAGDDYIVTTQDEEIQILIYNYAYLDQIYMSGNHSAISEKNRYDVFQEKSMLQVEITLKGIFGAYKLVRHYLNRDNGSAYDEWLKMGHPQEMTDEEIAYLKRKAYPQMVTEVFDCEGEYRLKTQIPPHGVELIQLRRIFR
jgi:xylan 1,4-beta-xylosidase